jgi:hypothetical protein
MKGGWLFTLASQKALIFLLESRGIRSFLTLRKIRAHDWF